MGKSLVIVESPAKVKTINKFLGKDYVVKSSIGHIRDLSKLISAESETKKKKKTSPAKDKKATEKERLVKQLGVNPFDNWDASYEILPGKEKVLRSLQEAAQKVDTIFLATDIDREGEAIAWHLMEAIGGDKSRYKRVTFTEITKRAIRDAFASPGKLNYDRVYAQQARRFLDRVVGYMLSPLLWQKIARGLSAGRVQSVAVRLISERERAIHVFKPEEYWEVRARLKSDQKDPFLVELAKVDGKPFSATNTEQANKVVDGLKAGLFVVKDVEKKPTTTKASAPFITSTLQQSASVRLGFGVKKTMLIAQRLYENGYITYMRTDSTNISADAEKDCRSYIAQTFGEKYHPATPIKYASKKSAQEAHEAIRPTDVKMNAPQLPERDPDAVKLYDLIWRQFVACQMAPALYDSTTVLIENGPYELKARGRVLRFDGYLKVQPQAKKTSEEEASLPPIEVGEKPKLLEVLPSQHFTKPPARFTEASLVRELEKRSIGRPSTYASIISTIQERGYVKLQNKRFYCLKMGEIVTDRLVENFQDLMDYSFTANMEEDLDKIANGNIEWRKVLDTFWEDFTKKLNEASRKMRGNTPTPTAIKCPECGRNMNIRTARTGVFLSCEGYSLPPKERCKGTLNLIAGDEMEAAPDEHSVNAGSMLTKKRCPKCDTLMDAYFIDETRKLHVCGNNPECDGHEVELGKFRIKGYEGPTLECDKCASTMVLKSGRFGKYFACSNAPKCKNTRKILKNGEPAPPRSEPVPMPELKCEKSDGYFILRDGAGGVFLASSNFPRSKETKKPQVADLIRHKDELDPKYLYLTKAPTKDPQGNPAIIRFSRKSKQHYVMSEDDEGKPTGWIAMWRDDSWSEKTS
ncbi:MAG: type I DNA topoisomerase [Deltaproteobacteria bacterium]|nr:type I DNA topoisomerase [Deltaproteobacteria bacterium]